MNPEDRPLNRAERRRIAKGVSRRSPQGRATGEQIQQIRSKVAHGLTKMKPFRKDEEQ